VHIVSEVKVTGDGVGVGVGVGGLHSSLVLLVRSVFSRLHSMLQLLINANVVASSLTFTVFMGAIRCSETSVLARATPRNNTEDGILLKRFILRYQLLDAVLPVLPGSLVSALSNAQAVQTLHIM
jgi:hypothetical protein